MTDEERAEMVREAFDWSNEHAREIADQCARINADGNEVSHVVVPRRFEPIANGATLYGYPVKVGDVDAPIVQPVRFWNPMSQQYEQPVVGDTPSG